MPGCFISTCYFNTLFLGKLKPYISIMLVCTEIVYRKQKAANNDRPVSLTSGDLKI